MLIHRAMIPGAVFAFATVLSGQSTTYLPLPEAPPVAAKTTAASSPSTARLGPSRVFHNFVVSAAGPYSLALGGFTAGIHQAADNPPEWRQGFAGLSERFGSNMGISAVGSATRIGIGELLNQDTSFHRCKCKGVQRRLTHAAFSALIAHQRSDGHAVFSVPALAAPYAATTTAVYAWYPTRYGIKDALRMGNYNLLGTVGTNIAFEFLPSSVNRFLAHFHLNNGRIANDED
jgi:hypothetical protein